MLTKASIKELPKKAVYTHVINGGHLLPEKKKYTMRDFKNLVKEGYSQVDARWVLICSNIYWHYPNTSKGLSQEIDTARFYRLCQMDMAVV